MAHSALFPEDNLKFAYLRKLYLPRVIVVSPLVSYLATLPASPMLVITSQSFEKKASALADATHDAYRLVVSGEPTGTSLDEVRTVIAERLPAIIVAIGGGSVIDAAKIVKKETGVLLVVCPTTPGSGSETTPYALYTENNQKRLVRSHELLPDVVVLDAEMLASIPKKQMGYFLFDILAHCLEGALSKMSTPFSDTFARQGIELIKSAEAPLADLQTAGFLGGIVQGMASVGYAHSLAHVFGARYNIPHARAISIFLAAVIRMNASDAQTSKKVKALGFDGVDDMLRLLDGIAERFGIGKETVTIGGKLDELEILSAVRKDFCAPTNPIRPSDEMLRAIFSEAVVQTP